MSPLLPFVSNVLNFVATTPVHRVFFPYAFGPTLHAARYFFYVSLGDLEVDV